MEKMEFFKPLFVIFNIDTGRESIKKSPFTLSCKEGFSLPLGRKKHKRQGFFYLAFTLSGLSDSRTPKYFHHPVFCRQFQFLDPFPLHFFFRSEVPVGLEAH